MTPQMSGQSMPIPNATVAIRILHLPSFLEKDSNIEFLNFTVLLALNMSTSQNGVISGNPIGSINLSFSCDL